MLSLVQRLTLLPCVHRVNTTLWSSSSSSLRQRFSLTVANADKLPVEPSNDMNVRLYTRRKQKGQEKYSSLVHKLPGDLPTPRSSSPIVSNAMEYSFSVSDGDLACSIEDHGFIIRLNRPTKKNSMTFEMYRAVTEYLKEVSECDDVHYLVLTSTGNIFSSGSDLSHFMDRIQAGQPPEVYAREATDIIRKLVTAFINFPKPAVALVNGPSIGTSCAVLGLCDLVYASDKAFFHAPFTLLGLNPMGCSSYTFPRAMGVARANRMLMLNEQLGAREAKECGFVTDVFPQATFHEETKQRLQQLSKLPPKSLQHSKELVRGPIRADLHKINDRECDRLKELCASAEAVQAVMNFFGGKGKL